MNLVCINHVNGIQTDILYIWTCSCFLIGYNYWIGLTDLIEGDFRWTYDQSKAEIKEWYPSYGSKGTGYNCVAAANHVNKLKPFDYTCSTTYRYICESNFCK